MRTGPWLTATPSGRRSDMTSALPGRARAERGPGARVARMEVAIRGDVIRLGQLLKLAGVADDGGEAKALLATGGARVNGEPETRRGRQVHPGDIVEVEGLELHVVGRPAA